MSELKTREVPSLDPIGADTVQMCAALTRDGLPCQRGGVYALEGLKRGMFVDCQLYCKQHKRSLKYLDKVRRFSRNPKENGPEKERFHQDILRFAGPLGATGGVQRKFQTFQASLNARRQQRQHQVLLQQRRAELEGQLREEREDCKIGRLEMRIQYLMGASYQSKFLGESLPKRGWHLSLDAFPADVFPRLRAIFRRPECVGCADYDAVTLGIAVQQYVNVKYPTANAKVILDCAQPNE